MSKNACNQLVRKFIEICEFIRFPVSLEKTEWATDSIVFLGIIIDGKNRLLIVPEEKRITAFNMIQEVVNKRKAMIGKLPQLAGLLNFIHKAVFPGRAFTCRMYSKFAFIVDNEGRLLKQHHHVKLDEEFKLDCNVWLQFLQAGNKVARPWLDFSKDLSARKLHFYTDASLNCNYGIGCIFNTEWMYGKWEENFIRDKEPSIEYTELFALVTGILTWQEKMANMRVVVFCDNKSVRNIVNASAGKCKNTMVLVRLLVLNNLKFNRRVFVEHVKGKCNKISDALSRQKLSYFRNIALQMHKYPAPLPDKIWPPSKIWMD